LPRKKSLKGIRGWGARLKNCQNHLVGKKPISLEGEENPEKETTKCKKGSIKGIFKLGMGTGRNLGKSVTRSHKKELSKPTKKGPYPWGTLLFGRNRQTKKKKKRYRSQRKRSSSGPSLDLRGRKISRKEKREFKDGTRPEGKRTDHPAVKHQSPLDVPRRSSAGKEEKSTRCQEKQEK